MNVEKAPDEKAYQKLGVLVWGSLVLALIEMVAGIAVNLDEISDPNGGGWIILIALIMFILILPEVGGIWIVKCIFYHKGKKYLREGNLREARMRGIVCSILSIIVMFVIFIVSIICFGNTYMGELLTRTFHLGVFIFQIYMVCVFGKLLGSQKQKGIAKKAEEQVLKVEDRG